MKKNSISKCHGVMVYYRQIDGEGEVLPHCSLCHKPAKLIKEEDDDKSSPDGMTEPPHGIRRENWGSGGHRHG